MPFPAPHILILRRAEAPDAVTRLRSVNDCGTENAINFCDGFSKNRHAVLQFRATHFAKMRPVGQSDRPLAPPRPDHLWPVVPLRAAICLRIIFGLSFLGWAPLLWFVL